MDTPEQRCKRLGNCQPLTPDAGIRQAEGQWGIRRFPSEPAKNQRKKRRERAWDRVCVCVCVHAGFCGHECFCMHALWRVCKHIGSQQDNAVCVWGHVQVSRPGPTATHDKAKTMSRKGTRCTHSLCKQQPATCTRELKDTARFRGIWNRKGLLRLEQRMKLSREELSNEREKERDGGRERARKRKIMRGEVLKNARNRHSCLDICLLSANSQLHEFF